MAIDSEEPTHRNHRRSPFSADELEEPSKRRKHRHHRHHRHHRRSSTRKCDESKRNEEAAHIEAQSKHQEEVEVAFPAPLGSNSRPDYDDMEEGEIVEDDDGFGGVDTDFVKKRINSDMEVKAAEVRGGSDHYKTGVHGAQNEYGLNSSLPEEDNLDTSVQNPKSLGQSDDKLVSNAILDENVNINDGCKFHKEVGLLGYSSSELYLDGHIGQESLKENYMPLTGSKSPVKERRKRKSYCDDDVDSRDWRKSSSSGNNGDKHKNVAHSPSNDRYHEVRNGSKSHDQARKRSRSQSILEEASLMKTTQQKDALHYTDDRRTVFDSDDDKMVGRNGNFQHDSRDLFRDKQREHSSSYSRFRVDRPHSRETQDKEREGSRGIWDRDREGREMDRDRKRERERDHDREKATERDRDGEREREREREREDREREDRQREREREREREKEKEKARERDREREKYRERERERERKESGRDRIRDRERDNESDRVSRFRNYEKNVDGYDDRDRYYNSKRRRQDEREHRDRGRKHDQERDHVAKIDPVGGDEQKSKRDEDQQQEYQERIALQLVDQEEEDLNRIKEESKRRRQAILEKYKTQQLHQQHEPHLGDKDKEHFEQISELASTVNVALKTLDGRNESVDTCVAGSAFTVGKSPPQNGISAFERNSGAGGLGEGTPKSERSNDMFCDDIFGESPAGVRKTGKGDSVAIERSGLHDNWDDAEGYYSYRFGEVLDGRYEVTAAHGKGVFSTVVRAKDLKVGPGDPEEVAIKIIRNNEHMHKAGKEELIILKKLVGADPDNKRHCVRFLSSFKYRNHLCLVFESLHMNLREVLKKFGRNIGLKLTAVRTYAKQLFIALKHLRNCGVLHSDIKPDNMLVNEAKNVLKLCDFGNAMFAGKNEITPYLVSRFYRAPEIILGLPYDHPMDIWSVGCCLFELYTGKVLFPGATNNDMLRLHMELKGAFPKKMLRKGAFTEQHFDQDLNFLATEEDPVTKKTMKRLIPSIKPKDIGAIVMSSPGEDPKMSANFRDLLEKIFVLDPDKRITVSQALSHPFITGK
ncbi:hypothetical protein ACSBR2_006170 [Camellia fascicularis]